MNLRPKNSEIANSKELKYIDPSQTELLEINKKDHNTFNFKFSVLPSAEDTSIYRIKNFTVYENSDTLKLTLRSFVLK